MAFTSYKAERHPETNELSALQRLNGICRGVKMYIISVLRLARVLELLPQIKDIVASLKEL